MSVLVKSVSTFIALQDTPGSYTDQAAKVTRVNAGESALEMVTEEAGLEFVIDGGGTVIATGEQGHAEVPFDGEIQSCELFADQPGAIKVDIWVDTYANFPPTDADTITGGNEPEITAGNQKDQDTTLTGWTKSLTKGQVMAFNVDSVTTIERCTVVLKVNKT